MSGNGNHSTRPRTPPLSPSAQSFAGTDRLSVLSATATDLSDFSPSPTASIGSVRIATLTKIPCRTAARRVSTGMDSIASEDDDRASDVAHHPRSSVMIGDATRRGSSPVVVIPGGQARRSSAFRQPSSPQQSMIMPDSVDGEPLVSELLAPVTRVLSPAPWLDLDDDENVPPVAAEPPRGKGLTTSRSLDLLGKFRPLPALEAKPEKTARREQPALGEQRRYSGSAHRRSASEAPLSRISSQNVPLAAARPLTPLLLDSAVIGSGKGSKSRFKAPSSTPPSSASFPSASAVNLRSHTDKRSDLDISEYLERGPRSARQASFEPTGLATPAAVEPSPPLSAPAGVLLFARRGITTSESKMSLALSATSSPATTPSPLTPAALTSVETSPALASQESYFTAVPGAPSAGAFPGGFGHRLISLEEARLRESERSAAARRKAASMPPLEMPDGGSAREGGQSAPRSKIKGESLSSRRGVPAPGSLKTSGSSVVLEASSATVIKPKRSGFLRRMIGGGSSSGNSNSLNDKASISPDPSRPSMSPSVSTLCLSPTLSVSASRVTEVPSPNVYEALSQPRISIQGTPERQDGGDAILQLSTSTSPTLSLRPVSTVLSAGLPADFFADATLAPGPTSASPTWSWSHPNSPTLSLSPPSASSSSHFGVLDLAAPRVRPAPDATTSPTSNLRASSIRGGGVYSSFDMINADPVASGGQTVPLAQFVALQAEFCRAKSDWAARELELEAQVRQLKAQLLKASQDGARQPTRSSSLGETYVQRE
ncbi:hypothetical protein JCM10908_004727 [Rhodotorula pacifica]|uniref:uncharacterized protein n=1 Tax=Rhodotorula pacifica TaxID=1495444 RepID=UPI0031815DC6